MNLKSIIRFTDVHSNAMAAMGALTIMFGGAVYLTTNVIENCMSLGCSCGESVMGLIIMMTAISAGVVFVLKQFSQAKSKSGLPDENGGLDV